MKPNSQRIVSLLPAATEMIFALGLGEQLAGVSHECDYPPEAKAKVTVVKPVLPLEKMTLREIDEAVSERLRNGQSLYEVDESALAQLQPDLIVTQNLCQVCAPSGNELSQAIRALRPAPQVLYLTPHSIEEILHNISELGRVTGRHVEAKALVTESRARLRNVSRLTSSARRKRVFFMEWADPVYCGGHWVPEMIELAGGTDAISRKGADSVRIDWNEVIRWQPEVLVFSPCGFNVETASAQVAALRQLPQWSNLPAVKSGRVYIVDANSYFARPGPRVVDGAELLAHLIHPDLCRWTGVASAFCRIESA